jgi:hypothetical protein
MARRPREYHGMTGTPVYQAWQNMLARSTPGSAIQGDTPSYVGVGRDPRWESFTEFYADMGGTHFPGAALARYGDTGDYTPSNCRWVTKAQNARDRIKHFTSDGVPGVDAAEANGVPRGTFDARISRGWSVDRAAGVLS